jgi:hypothetical protein
MTHRYITTQQEADLLMNIISDDPDPNILLSKRLLDLHYATLKEEQNENNTDQQSKYTD